VGALNDKLKEQTDLDLDVPAAKLTPEGDNTQGVTSVWVVSFCCYKFFTDLNLKKTIVAIAFSHLSR